MRLTHRLPCTLALVFTIGMSALPSFAQAPVYDGNQNMPPFGSFSGSNFDVVSLQNGNLHISIPLASLAQRGGKSIGYTFIFDTPDFQDIGTPGTQQHPQATIKIQPDFLYTGWRLSNSLNWGAAQEPVVPFTCKEGLSIFNDGTIHYQVIDPEGGRHETFTQQTLLGRCVQNVLKGPAFDGSGIVADITNNPQGVVTLKDGTIPAGIGSPNGLDTNGNQWNLTADTLNRSVLTQTNGPNTNFQTPLGKTSFSAPQFVTLGYVDTNGATQNYRIDYEAVDQNTSFLCRGATPPLCTDNGTSLAWIVPSKLTLPNGKFYQFTYVNNSWRELQRIDLPTGGYISYTYSNFCLSGQTLATENNFDCRKGVATRTVSDGTTTAQWTYTTGAVTSTVSKPDGNEEVHHWDYASDGFQRSANTVETEVDFYAGPASSGNIVKKVLNTYTGDTSPYGINLINVRLIQTDTTLDNGQTRRTQTDYETFLTQGCDDQSQTCGNYTATRLNPTAIREYDYGAGGTPGPLMRTTTFTYLHTGNQPYLNANIVDKVLTKTITDGNGVQVAQTTYEYDNYGHAGQPMVASNAIQHDSAHNTSFKVRGNVTATSRWRNTDGALLTSTNQYDDAGNILSTIDPLGNQTTFDYTDSWVSGGGTCAPSSGQGKIFPATITNALGQVSRRTYFSCTGAIGTATDPNLQPTTFTHDLFGRPIQVSLPDGGGSTDCYTDIGGQGCTQSGPPFDVITVSNVASGLGKKTTGVFDGLGRVTQTQLNSDPDGATFVDTTYDGLGRVHSVSNPHRATSAPTDGTTTSGYDALSRVIRLTQPDGSIVTTSYSGTCTTVTDEAGKSRKSCTDGLGRLTQVFEDPNTLNYETDYTYDALGNLLTVNQKGGTSSSANWRTRTFTYNSLSELLTSTNPESGTITYTYDNDGNVLSKTDARGITTAYAYDALNRVVARTFSDRSTPVAFFYDGQAPPPTSPSSASGTVHIFGTERLTITNPCDPLTTPHCPPPYILYDAGTVSITVNSVTSSASYGQNSTPSTIAADLVKAINGSTANVTATAANTVITLVAKGTGQASDYSLSAAATSNIPSRFPTPSFGVVPFGFTLAGGCNAVGSISITNAVGRRSGMCDAAGGEAWSFDPLGRPVADLRSINGISKTTSYAYNLDGSVKSLTYPVSGRTITYTLASGSTGTAGRLASATDNANNILYASGAHYAPPGGIAGWVLGSSSTFNGVNLSHLYNNRLQPCWMYATTGTPLPWNPTSPTACTDPAAAANVLDLRYGFNWGAGDNGNVAGITNDMDGSRSQAFGYDNLNRLTSAQTAAPGQTAVPSGTGNAGRCWGEAFSYDAWANLTSIAPASTSYNGCTQENLNLIGQIGANNRVTAAAFTHDAAGNVLTDGTNTYAWNAEGDMQSAAGVNYTYDGEGQRVQKSGGKLYWYGMGSEILEETDATASASNASFNQYIYFEGQRVARRDSSSNVFYYVEDMLGSSHAITTSVGVVCYDADFYPFGGERTITNTCPQNYKFTGKERDAESGNDDFGARYYSSRLGRWLSADWSAVPVAVPYADLAYPQSLNLYSYVGNNPLSRADADGHCYPVCTVLAGAGLGAVAGAVAEIGGEVLKGEKIDAHKIGKAALAGAITGAISGLAGPEAGLAAKAGLSIAGSIVGGATERALNGEKVVDGKEIAKDAAAGVAGVVVESKAERSMASTVVRKAVSTVIEIAGDAGTRSSESQSGAKDRKENSINPDYSERELMMNILELTENQAHHDAPKPDQPPVNPGKPLPEQQ